MADLRSFGQGVSRGFWADGMGGPVDMVTLLANLGIAGGGYAAHKAGLIQQPPGLIENPVGGSEWIAQKMRQGGLLADNPGSTADNYGRVAGGLLAPLTQARAPQIANALNQAPAALQRGAYAVGEKGADMAGNHLQRIGAQPSIFAGTGAKTADRAALAQAEKLTAAGADPRKIWKDTGWMKGGDGKWRFEIDDSGAALTERAQQVFTPGVVNADRTFDAMLPDAMTHKAFTDSYPMSIGVKATDDPTGGASFMSGPSPFSKDGLYRMVKMSKGTQEPRSTLLHEVQHAVQDHEGFARGGNINNASQWSPEFAAWEKVRGTDGPAELAARRAIPSDWNAYQRLAGEAEARAVEARMNLTGAQRRALFPLDSYDSPINSLIYR